MRYIPIILFVTLLLSCGGQKKHREVKRSRVEVIESHNTGLAQDTVQTAASAPKEEVKPAKEPVSSSRAARSSYRSYDNDDDNLRGWDPASEDDMDDNGMSRYMENNDEEGWD